MRKLSIVMDFNTDGDCDFKNESGYLNSKWEEYSKTIICEESEFFDKINELIDYLKSNVYNKYDQHAWLVEFVQNLSLKQIFKTESSEIEEYIDNYETILSGNQDFSFSVFEYKITENKLNEKIKTFKNLYMELKDNPDIIKFLEK